MGGRNAGDMYQNYLAELFILDLNTLVWTRAQDYSSPRLNAVCTIYNNTFISWGGKISGPCCAFYFFIFPVPVQSWTLHVFYSERKRKGEKKLIADVQNLMTSRWRLSIYGNVSTSNLVRLATQQVSQHIYGIRP